tara:strand:- start:84 stop:188 length:105 start_codon:yes stop_codon:yes gene_type:complete
MRASNYNPENLGNLENPVSKKKDWIILSIALLNF